MMNKSYSQGLWGRGAIIPVLVLALAFVSLAISVRADDIPSNTQSQATTTNDGTGGISTTTGGTVETGDATASSSISNALNTNETFPDQPGTTNSSAITASTTNVGVLESAATSTADTGNNVVVGGELANTIVTGTSIATANVINEVNTNIFNSDGLILFLNQLFGGGFDLNEYDLSYFFAGGPGASPSVAADGTARCTLLTCMNSSSLNVLDTNVATVTNSVIVRSSSGSNVASSTGDAAIATGNAYAAANVVNLVNTNIVNSSYLLLSFNNFGDLAEDIRLPGSDFFGKLFATGAASSTMNASTYGVQTVNDVNFMGTTTSSANTGNNLASTTTADASTTTSGSGLVETGAAYSSANTFTQANTTNVGGTSVFMLFRVAGTFTGQIVGLPPGLTQLIVPNGKDTFIEIMSQNGTTTDTAAQLLQKYNSSNFLAIATSTAVLSNNVDVSADTGNNEATTDLGTASVRTGTAYSSASVVNLVNTNIVGQNWMFAVFNIFGNFGGDIAFGRGAPALGLVAAPSGATFSPGSEVTYTFTVTNTGTADAKNVTLNATFDPTLLSFPLGSDATTTSTGAAWNLGRVKAGETSTYTFTAHIGSNFPAGATARVPFKAAVVNNSITSPVTSDTLDASITVYSPNPTPTGTANTSSNTSVSSAGAVWPSSSTSNTVSSQYLSITKTADVASTHASSTVNYKVVVYNDKKGAPIYMSRLVDTLYDPKGAVVYTRSWELDTLAPGDEIDLTYSVDFASSSSAGEYKNVAQVQGRMGTESAALSTIATQTHTVTIVEKGAVLGAATSCQVLSGYLARGKANNSADVMVLQKFLNAQLGTQIPVIGIYGPQTTAAVSLFQNQYASDILTPLGLKKPTGSVFGSTLAKINALGCGTTVAAAPMVLMPAASVVEPKVAAPAKPAPAVKPKAKVVSPVIKQAAAVAPSAPAPVLAPTPATQKGWFSKAASFLGW